MPGPTIDAIAADRLLRDIEATAAATVRRVVAGARDHAWLLERIGTVDVTTDAEFQRQLCRHAGMRGKLRMRRDDLFTILAEFRDGTSRTYPELLMRISELTGFSDSNYFARQFRTHMQMSPREYKQLWTTDRS